MTIDLTAEQYVAGAILIDPQTIPLIRGLVAADDFESEHCGAIFSAAMALYGENETVDPIAIMGRAKRSGVELEKDYILQLMEIVPTAANCAEYACRVAEDARVRRIKELAAQVQEDGISSSDELLAALKREADAIQGSSFQRGLLSPADTLRRFTDHVVDAGNGTENFVPSGFHRLDETLGGGFLRGGLYIIGARPAVGKSTFSINLADNIKGNCLLVSLEMSVEQIVSKRVSRLTGLYPSRLLSGSVTEKDWEQIAVATSALSTQGVYQNRRYDLTVAQIQLLAQAVPELQAVIIDYLGLIQPATRGGSTYENISQISRELKRMALSLNVPVVCLCQLSRAVESRKDKKPTLSDLRDSGAIEQDADAVLFLYRPDYYAGGPTDAQPSLVELEVAKNRHGRTGQVEYSFWMPTSTFKEVL